MSRSTEDVVVVGWIDRNGISTSSLGVDPAVTTLYAFGAPLTAAGRVRVGLHLMRLLRGNLTRPSTGTPLSPFDAHYVLRWLFWTTANPPPPPLFASNEALAAFRRTETNFKLYNRLRISFDTTPTGMVNVNVEHMETDVGKTRDPVLHLLLKGQRGQYDGNLSLSRVAARLVNDGTPDWRGVEVMNNLAGVLGHGRLWSNIGSRLEVGVTAPSWTVACQVYPTYNVYRRDGSGVFALQTPVIVQASDPYNNFSTAPYHDPRPSHAGVAPFHP